MNHSSSFQSTWLRFVALLVAALMLGRVLHTQAPVQASWLAQTSPLAAPQDQVSPLPTEANSVAPASPASTPAATAKSAGRAPIPVAAVAGVMAVIALAALMIGLRKREQG